DLGYYDPWYQTAPHIHQSVGVLVILFMILRYLWRRISPPPTDIATQAQWEHMAAHFAHAMLYLLVLVICISGYLINADENAVPVFNWFEIPSLLLGIEDQEELMGEIHDYGAWVMIILSAGHALAAIKHHIFDRDDTLKRML
ncbi:MAG: cytochrome b, partial [Motiliproteus sp.]|nr:cytochrome b [Motiliproteus sp.]